MKWILLIAVLVFASSCKTVKEVDYSDFEILDTIQVTSTRITETLDNELPVYNPSYERIHDLLHTELRLSFDWKNKLVLGKARLSLSPLFYESDTLRLDAQNFDLHAITLDGKQKLKYEYDGNIITIILDKKYKREEEYTVELSYTANPSKTKGNTYYGGHGLYFIDHDNTNNAKPQQIWTQGETEYNSRWFPTIDKPNERCTQEIYLTVDNDFKTLSNGVMLSSTVNEDGTRTDYWKQSLPHAPYLFAIVVGEYAIVDDKWQDTDLSYYVEPEYAIDAKEIFNNTPEMMEFFSNVLDFPYPWEKYSQVVVSDFVSGAMENTTASIYGDFIQKTQNELIDGHNDNIVAHELFHHWFGNLVTCEDWANLTLNEGFANYSEYLWLEHKYGNFHAEHHRVNEKNAYIESTIAGTHPLIHYSYKDKEDMFDAHSYNKGGLVLHMLKNIVGKEAFFSSLNKYLVDNQYTAVEVDELRMAFEDTTGKDLKWFFNQWFHDNGHPTLEFDHQYDVESSMLKLDVKQVQEEGDHKYVFELPTNVMVYYEDGTKDQLFIHLKRREQQFSFPVKEKPAVVVLDGTHDLLADINTNYSLKELKALYTLSSEFEDKQFALRELRLNPEAQNLYTNALNQDYYYFRNLALNYEFINLDAEQLSELVIKDDHSKVRANALAILIETEPKEAFQVSKKIINKEKSIRVLSKAVKNIYKFDKEAGTKYADSLYNADKRVMKITLLDIFSASEDEKYLPYLNEALLASNQYEFFPIARFHLNLAEKAGHENMLLACDALGEIITRDNENSFKKITAFQNMDKLKSSLISNAENGTQEEKKDRFNVIDEIDEKISEIIENEEDEELKSKYIMLLETR